MDFLPVIDEHDEALQLFPPNTIFGVIWQSSGRATPAYSAVWSWSSKLSVATAVGYWAIVTDDLAAALAAPDAISEVVG